MLIKVAPHISVAMALFCGFLLTGCSSTPNFPPNHICSILIENKSWGKAVSKAKKKWGLPPHVGLAFVYKESSFKADARPPREKLFGVVPWARSSSAFGFAQATDEAWSDYIKDTRRRGAKRNRFRDAIDFIGWFNHQSKLRLGLRKDDVYDLYLAYYNGHTGYKRGQWRRSKTVKGYAAKTASQAKIYRKQLRRCGRLV